MRWSAVEANRAARNAPFAPGETSRPFTLPENRFEDKHWEALQRVIDAVRRDAPAIYNRFAAAQSLGRSEPIDGLGYLGVSEQGDSA